MEDELYLDNIDEFVTDQNRVVTYKWLSYTLGVHVNQAKQMLYDYVERKRKENSGAQLHVTYLVAGNLVQNGYICHKVAVVREDKLEAVKSKLATIASVHVYSIQKALLKDSGPLYNTDYDIIKTNLQNCSKFSAIHCAAAVPRTLAEVSQAHTSAQIDSQAPNDMQVSTASSKPPAKGNTMSNFFGKAAMNKLKASSESEQAKEEKEVTKPSVPAAEPKLPPATTVDKPGKKTEPVKIQKKDRKSRAKRVDLSDNEEEKEAENLKKKRRRIKQPQSDSSDNEADGPASSISQEDRAPTPSPEPPPKAGLEPASTEVKASTGGKKRKRRRVLKSKTFLDDEGCMVTEKVYESESCTDSEEEFSKAKPAALHRQSTVPVKKDPKEDQRGPKKGATTASKANKQVSIMGFFQKK
ncbi:PREDICTED: DNA polymerase delta subunit 3 isoform X4 [Gavialis gangeticus]|uniref:DNA polymerase delta subunit 3 isoform X4 n=1 Tax=Gavialis gangeticus TaxID=94835 RepID=UPI00092E26F9|nr:PREDICTED: DNA polymerase delta subunit 3 isoform X4 [Gavialis gangeticus]